MPLPRWIAWMLRAPLVLALATHVLRGFGAGARMAAVGLALSFLPRAITALSGRRMPWLAELPYVTAVSLEATSKAFRLPARIRPWDKLVHFAEIGLLSWLTTVFLRGYRDTFNPGLPNRPLPLAAVLSGISVGALWEIVEYTVDRWTRQNLVKSARGTVLDLLVDSLGAVAGAAIATRLYERATEQERAELGEEANWMAGQPSGSSADQTASRAT